MVDIPLACGQCLPPALCATGSGRFIFARVCAFSFFAAPATMATQRFRAIFNALHGMASASWLPPLPPTTAHDFDPFVMLGFRGEPLSRSAKALSSSPVFALFPLLPRPPRWQRSAFVLSSTRFMAGASWLPPFPPSAAHDFDRSSCRESVVGHCRAQLGQFQSSPVFAHFLPLLRPPRWQRSASAAPLSAHGALPFLACGQGLLRASCLPLPPSPLCSTALCRHLPNLRPFDVLTYTPILLLIGTCRSYF